MFTMRQARQYAGLTQKEVADHFGVSLPTYTRIEHEPERATIAQAKKFSGITGIPLDEIFFGSKST